MAKSDHILTFVMPGLDPGIHAFAPLQAKVASTEKEKTVDGRVKPGHDGLGRQCEKAF
jgi:hypothetical protein